MLLKTGRGRTTACTALHDAGCEEHELRISRVVRSNLRARVADVVSVHPCNAGIRDDRRVHVLPVDDTVDGVPGDLLQSYVRRYFHDAYHPVHEGDRFLVRGGGGARSVEFKVVQIDGDPAVEFCMVTRSTEIFCHSEPVRREEDEERLADVGDDGVGGGGAQADDLDQRAGRAATRVAPVFFPVYSHEAMKRGEYCAIRWIWH